MQPHDKRPAPPFFRAAPLIIFIVIAPLFTVGWILAQYVPSTRARLLYLRGLSECNYQQSVDSYRHIERLAGRAREMQSASHKIAERDGQQLWDTPLGNFWHAGEPHHLFFAVLAEMDTDVYSGRTTVKPGAVVLDCGAHVGSFTRLALNAGAAKVVALEIFPDTQESLRNTFREEIAAGRVFVYPKGVWSEDTSLSFDDGKSAFPVTTIDKITAELGLERVDVIKMDIEGSEPHALRGAQETLKKHHPDVLIASEHGEDDITALPALVKSFVPGYREERDNCQYGRDRIRALTLKLFGPPAGLSANLPASVN